jgi:hypothetical protein
MRKSWPIARYYPTFTWTNQGKPQKNLSRKSAMDPETGDP